MKKKTILTLSALLTSLCIITSGCQKETGADTASAANTSTTAKASEETPVAESPKPTQEPTPEPTEEPKESLPGYEYVLYSYANDGEPILGFNIPLSYSISSHSTKKHSSSGHPFFQSFSTGSAIKNTYMYLSIDTIGYQVTDDNKLICTNEYDKDYTATAEAMGELETAYGNAQLYYIGENMGSYTSYKEVALLPIGNDVVKFEVSHSGSMDSISYTGKLKTLPELLPELLIPSSMDEFEVYSTELDDVEKNNIPVDKNNYTYIYYQDNSWQDSTWSNDASDKTAVIGTNNISGWDNFGGEYCSSGDQRQRINIETSAAEDRSLYNFYFEETRVWMEDWGTITDKQQVGEVETPFGTAKLYYVQLQAPDGKKASRMKLLCSITMILMLLLFILTGNVPVTEPMMPFWKDSFLLFSAKRNKNIPLQKNTPNFD